MLIFLNLLFKAIDLFLILLRLVFQLSFMHLLIYFYFFFEKLTFLSISFQSLSKLFHLGTFSALMVFNISDDVKIMNPLADLILKRELRLLFTLI